MSVRIIQELKFTELSPGDLAFWWLGQHSFIVKTCNNLLLFDIFLSDHGKRIIPSPVNSKEIKNADFIFGTHNHRDHIDNEILPDLLSASEGSFFIFPEAVREDINISGVDSERLIGMNHSQVFEEDGITVKALKAKHEFFDVNERGLYSYLQYIVKCDDLFIYHSGDTLLYDGMTTELKNYKIDLAFIPINGRDAERFKRGCMGNLTYQEAVDLTGEINPRVVIPAHFGMFPDNSGNPKQFEDYMREKFPDQKTFIPQVCRKYLLSEIVNDS